MLVPALARSNNGWHIYSESMEGQHITARGLLALYDRRMARDRESTTSDGNRSDDRFANLAARATNSQNNTNRVAPRKQQHRCPRCRLSAAAALWRARLMVGGVYYDAGYFRSLDEAVAARKELERLHLDEDSAPR